jgi:hypothetical protein
MFLASELATWLTDRGINAEFYSDGQSWEDIEQDVGVILAIRPGAPTILERTYDRPTVQVTLRGPQNDPDGAEKLANAIDDALLAPTVTTIGETRVISIDRLGGGPASVGRDPGRRDLFTCSYTFQSARTVF